MQDKKEIIEEMKSFFGVTSLEDVAEKLGYSRTTAGNWRKKGLTDTAFLKFEKIRAEQGIVKYIQENNPDREYKSIEDIKRRLGIKGNEALARFLRVSVSEVIRLRDSKEKIPQDMQNSARVVEYLLKDMAASCDGMKDDENWAILNYESARNVIIDDDMLRLIDLIVHHGSKEVVSQMTQKFEALKKALDSF